MILAAVAEHEIDFCVCMWGNAPATLDEYDGKNFFDAHRLPILMHWLDAPQWAHQSQVLDVPRGVFNGPYCYHYINNSGTAQEMAGVLEFSNVITLSNAASPARFRPQAAGEKDFDIVFGVAEDTISPTPMMLEELDKEEPNIQAIRADVAYSLRSRLSEFIHSVCSAPALADRLVDLVISERLQSRHTTVLAQMCRVAHAEPSVARAVLALLQDARRYVGFSSTLRQIESWERAFTLAYLSRYFRCATFGFKCAFAEWPGQWEYLGELPYDEQCAAYGRSRFGLNVMRWQDDVGLNLMPFEITLSGACLLQAYRVGVEEHFGESEAIVFNSPQECRGRVADLLTEPERILRIAEAGRERSLLQHCWHHRAADVTRIMLQQIHTADPARRSLSESIVL
jgi:hypothetical protein